MIASVYILANSSYSSLSKLRNYTVETVVEYILGRNQYHQILQRILTRKERISEVYIPVRTAFVV
jgi:hypothetical protein